MKSSSKLLAGLFLLALPLAGCGHATTSLPHMEVVEEADSYAFEAVRPAKEGYILANGDVFDVTFLFEKQLDTRVKVRPDGGVALPIVGDVLAAGRTPAELDSQLTAAYATYYREPEITVNVVDFAPPTVYVMGEVRVPGDVELVPGLSMLQAIAVRGGPLVGANMGSVMLLRRLNDRQALAQRIDLERVLEAKNMAADPLLAPYDIIYVPPSFITRIGRFVDQFFNKLTPIPILYLRGWESFHTDDVYDTFLRRTVTTQP